jgi:hypothetical protein
MNLLNSQPKCHRELFDWDNEGAPKEVYSLDDLIEYIVLSFAPPAQLMSGGYTTKSALKDHHEKVIKEARVWTDNEKEHLVRLVELYGLEEVLYSIDILEEEEFNLDDLPRNIDYGKAYMNSIIRSRDVGSN